MKLFPLQTSFVWNFNFCTVHTFKYGVIAEVRGILIVQMAIDSRCNGHQGNPPNL